LNAFTASFTFNTASFVTTSSFQSYTSSTDTKFVAVGSSTSSLNTATASLFTSASLSLTTASVNVNIITFRKGDGTTFDIAVVASGSVIPGTITGSAQITALGFVSSSVTASSLITASFSGNTLTFTKGDATTFGIVLPDVSGSQGSFVTTSSFNAYTQSNDQRVSSLETNSASVNISITNINSTTASLNTSVTNLNQFTASQSTASIVNSITELNTFSASALISINNINQTTASLNTSVTNLNQFTASQYVSNSFFATTGSNNFVGNQTMTGSLYVSSSTQKDVIIEGQLWVSSSNMFASGSTIQPQVNIVGALGGTAGGSRSGSMQLIPDKITILRGTRTVNISSTVINVSDSGVGTAGQSAAIYPTGIDNGTLDGKEIGLTINGANLGVTNFNGPSIWIADNTLAYKAVFGFEDSASYTDGRVVVLTPLSASAGFTASLQNGYAWVGNSLGQNTQVLTSSFAGATINTGSFATTGSNSFIGNQTITGSLTLSSSAAIELQVIGNSVFTGSAFGNVVALSITSNTASMDLSLGNYFTLTLAGTATTHISASNVQPGVSATLVITTGTNSSASLAPTMLQPSGSSYSATNGSSKKDVLSIVAVASGVPFVVSTKNMI